MGYYYTTEHETAVPGKSSASPKTHTPGSPVKERGHRYYMPESGRWASRDPLVEIGSIVARQYVQNLLQRRELLVDQQRQVLKKIADSRDAMEPRRVLLAQWMGLMEKIRELDEQRKRPIESVMPNTYLSFDGNPISSYDSVGLYGPCKYTCGQIGYPVPYWFCLLTDPNDCPYCTDTAMVTSTPLPGHFIWQFDLPCPCPVLA